MNGRRRRLFDQVSLCLQNKQSRTSDSLLLPAVFIQACPFFSLFLSLFPTALPFSCDLWTNRSERIPMNQWSKHLAFFFFFFTPTCFPLYNSLPSLWTSTKAWKIVDLLAYLLLSFKLRDTPKWFGCCTKSYLSKSPLLTQNSEAIVERHDDDFADGGQDAAVVRIARSPAVRFTMDEHDDGVARPQGGRTRCKSICEEKKTFN